MTRTTRMGQMTIDRRRLRRCGAVLAALVLVTTISTRPAAADPKAPAPGAAQSPASQEPEPRCHRDQDLACTLVRETAAGVWLWTVRFRPAEAGNSGWTLAVGAGAVTPGPVAQFIAPARTPAPPTPNGAPILE